MSKLQFTDTFLAGAVYSLLSLLECGALGYFLYLYYIQLYATEPLPFIIGVSAIGFLYLLNIIALIAQNVIVCADKPFRVWNTGCNSCFYVFVNFFSFLINHKFRNIVFCRLFTFLVFTAQL